jgi:leader peptidase (prepilin peptidase)/N-methyltransferase
MMNILKIIIVFIFGICIGSFLNVCIFRIPRKKSLVRPPSSCPDCGTKIRPWDNIPLASFAVLRGKCRDCGAKISWQYPIIEAFSGIAAVFVYRYYSVQVNGEPSIWQAGAGLFFIYLLTVITAIDMEFRIIPNSLIIVGLAAGAVFQITLKLMSWWGFILGGIMGFGFLVVTALLGKLLFRKESLGIGDIKLGLLLGIFLGDHNIVVCLLTAFVSALVISGGLKLLKGDKLAGEISFAPYLMIGGVVGLFWGSTLERMYRLWVGI